MPHEKGFLVKENFKFNKNKKQKEKIKPTLVILNLKYTSAKT